MKTYFLLIIVFLLLSCSNQKETSVKQFIVTSIENEVIVSVKSNFNDTLFYEHRFSDSINYSYILLTKEQNEELKNLIENVCKENDYPKFELSSNEAIFIIDKGKVGFYKEDFSKKSKNFEKINSFFRETSLKMVKTSHLKNFWNIGTVIPPPNPPKKIKDLTFKNKVN